MATLSSRLVFELVDRATGPLGKLGAALGRFQAQNMRIAGGLVPGGGLRTFLGVAAGYTAISAALGGTVGAAARFESAMNRVRAASGASVSDMRALTQQAMELGRETKFSATEAAGAQEMLLRNGVKVTDVLNGATDATLKLAAAGGAELAPAADLMSDVLAQFKIPVNDAGRAVDRLAGLMNASKFAFEDAQMAYAQAGGVAGQLGVSFEDFNAGLAATSNSFASGSDAGTSFKTFLQRLVPASKPAAKAMKKLGLEFFDTAGQMKSMEDIAQELKEGTAGLSEREINDYYSTIFGTDAIRTALALADQGREGLRAKMRDILAGDAKAMADARMQGLEGAKEQFNSAAEALGISVGNLLLPSLTSSLNALTPVVARLSEMGGTVDSVFNRIAAAGRGLAEGLGLDDIDLFGGLKSQIDALDRFVFGTEIDESLDGMLLESRLAAGEGRVAGITAQFRELGGAIRAAAGGDIDALGRVGAILGEIGSGLSGLGAAGAAVGIGVIASLGRALIGLGIGLMMTRAGQIGIIVAAITELVKALNDPNGFAVAIANMDLMTKSILGLGGALLGLRLAQSAPGKGIGKMLGDTFGWMRDIGKGKATPGKSPHLMKPSGRGGRWGLFGLAAGAVGLGALLTSGGSADAAEAVPPTPRARPSVPTVGQAASATTALGRGVSWLRAEDQAPRQPGESALAYNLQALPGMLRGALFDALATSGVGKLGALASTLSTLSGLDGFLARVANKHAVTSDAEGEARRQRSIDMMMSPPEEAMRGGPGGGDRFGAAFGQFDTSASEAEAEAAGRRIRDAAQRGLAGGGGADALGGGAAGDTLFGDLSARITAAMTDLEGSAAAAGQQTMGSYGAAVAAGGGAAVAAAQSVGAQVEAGLNVTGRPTVDVSSIMSAIAAVRALKAELAGIGAAANATAASVAASGRQMNRALRNNFGDVI